MSQQEILDTCPLCQGGLFDDYISTKDYTVSGEDFSIVSCQNCGFRFTNPRPTEKILGTYYNSDEYVSHSNNANSLVNAVYKIARKFTLRWKYQMIKKEKISGNVLDYGCGTGEFLNYCKAQNWKIAGVEPNDKARKQAAELTLESINTELDNVPTVGFDVITLWHVLEHIPRLNDTLIQLKDLLTPQGYMLLAIPNCKSHDARLFKEHWAAYDVPRHLYHFTQETLNNLVENHGMKVVDVLPMKLDAYYVSLLSNKIKYGRNKLINSFLTGLLSNIYAVKNKEYSSLIYVIKKHNE